MIVSVRPRSSESGGRLVVWQRILESSISAVPGGRSAGGIGGADCIETRYFTEFRYREKGVDLLYGKEEDNWRKDFSEGMRGGELHRWFIWMTRSRICAAEIDRQAGDWFFLFSGLDPVRGGLQAGPVTGVEWRLFN